MGDESRYSVLVPSRLTVNIAHAAWISVGALIFAVATLLAAIGIADVSSVFAGDGRPGRFEAITRDCGQPKSGDILCSWRGTYTAADGTTVEDALLDVDLSAADATQTQQVLWNGDTETPVVYLDEPRGMWKTIAVIVGIWSIVTGFCAYIVLRSRSRRRRKLAEATGTERRR